MPKYDYKCDTCKQDFEIEKSINEPHPENCECGGKLARIFSAVPVAFKGSGFYKTGG